jgi:hypothetical protein
MMYTPRRERAPTIPTAAAATARFYRTMQERREVRDGIWLFVRSAKSDGR